MFACMYLSGADALRDTDICEHTLDVLSTAGAGIRRVLVLGRRGHVQASFTIKVGLRTSLGLCADRRIPAGVVPVYKSLSCDHG